MKFRHALSTFALGDVFIVPRRPNEIQRYGEVSHLYIYIDIYYVTEQSIYVYSYVFMYRHTDE